MKVKLATKQIKNSLQDRINQIRRSYPYYDISQKPGLTVATMAGDPTDANTASPAEKSAKLSNLAVI